jgi:chromosome segregation protein
VSYHLKSLELNGYKTFASKSKFDFSGNITAVVGPNGSGKSNIADSLRWVLGEQSYSLLRGRKTDDMIFAGSESRPRSSMASVKVTFDNSDGWLPIDFSEVSITRRAYRDGQNEYLLNNQRVRLRDVSELLSKSGLAERTYTVIGQGLVDTALSLKADERRRLFEEAAGIGLYRKRKDLSIRRLDKTKRNIERVQDILAELAPRLKSLERQSRRAQEYDHVRADLKEILREWYGYHWHLGQREFRSAKEGAARQEKILIESRNNQSDKDQELVLVRNNVNSLRARLNSWHRQLAQIHTKREETSRNLAVNNERTRSLIERQSQLNLDNNSLRKEYELQNQKLEEAKKQVARIESEKVDAENNGLKANNILDKLKGDRQSAENELELIQRNYSQLNARNIELTALEKDLVGRIEGHSSSKAETQIAFDQAKQAYENAMKNLELAANNLANSENELLDIEQKLNDKRENLESLEEDFTQQTSELNKSESSFARFKAQHEVLTDAEKSLSGYAEGAKLLLNASQKGKLLGTKGALNAKIKVSSEFEQAIASALGEYLDAVILNSSGDTEKALEILENNPAKATLLPISQIVPDSPIMVKSFPGNYGVAADLVDAPAEFRPVIDLLLGQVLIVKDRGLAKRVIHDLEPGSRVVTLRGEVFHSNGTILINGDAGAATLSRPRVLHELMGKIQTTQKSIGKLKNNLNQLSEQREISKDDISVFNKDIAEKNKLVKILRSKHHRLNLETEQVKNSSEWHANQLKILDENAKSAKNQIVNIKQEKENILKEVELADSEIRSQTTQVGELDLGEFTNQVSHWEKRVAVISSEYKDANRALSERNNIVSQHRESLENLKGQQDVVDKELNEIVDSVSSMRTSETGISGQIAEIQILIDPAEAELQELEAKQIILESEESKSRQSLNMAERYHSQAQITLAKKQESLDTLRQRIEDDFGLVEFEYEQDVSGPTPLPLGGKLVERLQVVSGISEELEQTLKSKRMQLRRMGSINPEAHQEYLDVKERFGFMTTQVEDLEQAEKDIREVIAELDALMGREFRKTFEVVAMEFKNIFARLFKGGSAKLMLTDEENMDETGVDIEARLPGKRMQRLALLSGGERAMTAVALVFALLKASPTPFCVMDEVDAALDEANISRLRELLEELSKDTQFVLITHNRNTVQIADLIYGITMGKDTASQTISLKLEEVDDRYSS